MTSNDPDQATTPDEAALDEAAPAEPSPDAPVPEEESRVPGGASAVVDAPGGLPAAVEAILMVAESPVPAERIASVLAVPTAQVTLTLQALLTEYASGPRPYGFELREVAGGWRFYSAPAFSAAVDAFVLEGQTARLTQAALETLAVIAYRQPVSRGRVSAIRGVNVDSVVRTLLSRGLVEEAGRDADGGATLYRTTSYFLERLGLRTLDDLPPLAPYLPDIDAFDDIDGASS